MPTARLTAIRKQVALFGYFSLTWQEKLAEQMDAQLLTQLAELMPHDERADLLTQLEPELQQQVLEQMDSEERSDIQRLVAYPEESVGAVMTSDFAVLSADYTVEQAMQNCAALLSKPKPSIRLMWSMSSSVYKVRCHYAIW